MELKNEYALITGATSGIGYELAKLFAQNGYHLVLVARSSEVLELKSTGVSGSRSTGGYHFQRSLRYKTGVRYFCRAGTAKY